MNTSQMFFAAMEYGKQEGAVGTELETFLKTSVRDLEAAKTKNLNSIEILKGKNQQIDFQITSYAAQITQLVRAQEKFDEAQDNADERKGDDSLDSSNQTENSVNSPNQTENSVNFDNQTEESEESEDLTERSEDSQDEEAAEEKEDKSKRKVRAARKKTESDKIDTGDLGQVVTPKKRRGRPKKVIQKEE